MKANRFSLTAVAAVVLLAALSIIWVGCSSDQSSAPIYEPYDATSAAVLPASASDIAHAMAVQDRHDASLEAIDGVFGTATSQDAGGHAVVLVMADRSDVHGVPAMLEGVPVRMLVTDRPELFPGNGGHGGGGSGGGGGGGSVDFTTRADRPVPMGYSVGNYAECASGTYGCAVTRGGNLYALSNNHVFARENAGSIGEICGQPGLYDGSPQCNGYYADTIGSLADFVPVQTGSNAQNTVDCAIVLSSSSFIDCSTPAGYYGQPNTQTANAVLDMAIQKVGRTTGLTTGTVIGVNASVSLTYAGATTQFVDQVLTSSKFSKAGDSGSLIVTNDSNANPVGLLFAGNRQGYTWFNRIDNVLSALNVQICGK